LAANWLAESGIAEKADWLRREFLTGAGTGFIPGPKITGITAGRGGFGQVTKQVVTKAARGQIKNIAGSTAQKMIVHQAATQTPAWVLGGAIKGVEERFSSSKK